MKRSVFFISDSTGITSETLGRSLLTQFPQFEFENTTIPYINSVDKANEAVRKINQACRNYEAKAIVFSTLAKQEIRNIISGSSGMFIDFFSLIIPSLEYELQSKYAQNIGKLHSISNLQNYDKRVSAIEYAINCDDGVGVSNYHKADVILIGVSRSGKSPTCLYLAIKFGIFAANYPLTDEDLNIVDLPARLQQFKHKLFGLTVTPDRLHEIREKRHPDSEYAKIEQCKKELQTVEQILKHTNIPRLDSTNFSIEEIATKIITEKNLHR